MFSRDVHLNMALLELALHEIRVDGGKVIAVIVVVAHRNCVSGLDALLEGVVLGPLVVLLFWVGHVEGRNKLKSLPG